VKCVNQFAGTVLTVQMAHSLFISTAYRFELQSLVINTGARRFRRAKFLPIYCLRLITVETVLRLPVAVNRELKLGRMRWIFARAFKACRTFVDELNHPTG